MNPTPQDAPLSVRLGARLGPEVVASILVVVVLFVAVAVALSGRRGSAGDSSPSPSLAAIVPSESATVVPTAAPPATPPSTASPRATPTPVANPTQPPVTLPPAQRAAAVLVRDMVDRLLGERADLEAELAKSATDAGTIPDLLRQVNESIVQEDEPLADLASYPSTADLARRIRAVNTATLDTVNRIQHTSPKNAKTYRDGAVEVVAKLEPLPGLRSELAALTR